MLIFIILYIYLSPRHLMLPQAPYKHLWDHNQVTKGTSNVKRKLKEKTLDILRTIQMQIHLPDEKGVVKRGKGKQRVSSRFRDYHSRQQQIDYYVAFYIIIMRSCIWISGPRTKLDATVEDSQCLFSGKFLREKGFFPWKMVQREIYIQISNGIERDDPVPIWRPPPSHICYPFFKKQQQL